MMSIKSPPAHFRTGNGFAVDLEAWGLERECWHQSGLNAVGEGEFGLHSYVGQPLISDEGQQHSKAQACAQPDADGVEYHALVQPAREWEYGTGRHGSVSQPCEHHHNKPQRKGKTKFLDSGSRNACRHCPPENGPEETMSQTWMIELQ
jgi:hypothetical protein